MMLAACRIPTSSLHGTAQLPSRSWALNVDHPFLCVNSPFEQCCRPGLARRPCVSWAQRRSGTGPAADLRSGHMRHRWRTQAIEAPPAGADGSANATCGTSHLEVCDVSILSPRHKQWKKKANDNQTLTTWHQPP